MDEQKKVSIKDEDEFMKECRERFRESENAMSDIIEAAMDDIEMVSGENQWDNDVAKFRRDHGLVMVTENILPSFLDQVEGDFRQNKQQVRCVAVDDRADPGTARVLEGMLRNIDNQSQAEMIYNEAFLLSLASSYSCWRIGIQYADPMEFNREIVTLPIENHFALRWDMSCKRFDTSDKKWATISESMSKEAFRDAYPNESPISFQAAKGTEYDGWYLSDGSIRRAEYWYVEDKDIDIVLFDSGDVVKKSEAAGIIRKFTELSGGQVVPRIIDERKTSIPTVYSCIVSGEKILEGPFEWKGKYIPIPIAFGKRLNVNGKLKLKSLIRDAKESQRMHNYLVSSMVQGVAMQQKAPYIGTTEQFAGKKAEWQAGIDGDVPFLTYNKDPMAPGAPQRQTPPMASQGFAELLQFNNKTRMDIIGIHEAGLGARSNEQSGVAIKARQQEGDTGTYVFLDNFKHALTFDARIKIDLIPHIYDTPRMQRITGIDNKDEFVQLYEQAMGPNGPYLKNNPKVGKYDVVVTTGPSFNTKREETRDAMVQMMQALGPQNPASGIILPSIIKSLDWQDGDLLAKALTAALPPPIQEALSNSQGDGEPMDPKMQAMQAQVSQQVQQMQAQAQQAMQEASAQIQQLQQDNQQLQSGMQVKMAELAQKKELSDAELQLEREKLMAEMTMRKEEQDTKLRQIEIEAEKKHETAMEELKARMTIDLTVLHEKILADQRIKQMELDAVSLAASKEQKQ